MRGFPPENERRWGGRRVWRAYKSRSRLSEKWQRNPGAGETTLYARTPVPGRLYPRILVLCLRRSWHSRSSKIEPCEGWRHTAATADSGPSRPYALSSAPAITLALYAHSVEERDAGAAEHLGSLIERSIRALDRPSGRSDRERIPPGATWGNSPERGWRSRRETPAREGARNAAGMSGRWEETERREKAMYWFRKPLPTPQLFA